MAERRMLQALQKFVDDDGSAFFDRIEKFCMDCIDDLPDSAAPVSARQSSHDSVTEYPPAFLAAHRRYIDVVESSIEQFLTEQGYSLRDVAAALAASESQADAVYRSITAITDFDVFVQMLNDVRANKFRC